MHSSKPAFHAGKNAQCVLAAPSPTSERLRAITHSLYAEYADAHRKAPERTYAAGALYVACAETSRLIQKLNAEELQTATPWKQSGFISIPTFIANVKTATQLFPVTLEPLDALLRSFCKWELCASQKINCCCGTPFSTRTVPYSIALRTILNESQEADSCDVHLCMRQHIGIKTSDVAHRAMHYNFSRVAEDTEDIAVIFSLETRFKICTNNSGEPFVVFENVEIYERADEFNFKEFLRWFQQSLEVYRNRSMGDNE